MTGGVVSNFIMQALRGEPITIYGNGTQTRSFCFVDDLIGGMLAMMATPPDIIGPINIGNPKRTQHSETCGKGLFNSRAAVRASSSSRCPPTTHAEGSQTLALQSRSRAGHPKVDLDDGLKRTIDYFKDTFIAG